MMTVGPDNYDCDLLVVGGGINGAGIARDAAGRGLSVLLCEKDDLASHTSSASSKLIHGGIRYLEHYEFGLVRKALMEREVLLRSAPHIIRPLRFVLPHDKGQRPVWMVRLGLFLYDRLAKRELLPPSTTIDLRRHAAGEPLKTEFTRGFMYSDAWVDDARLVVLNALDAAKKGAVVLTRTACVAAERMPAHWQAILQTEEGRRIEVKARCLVNAAGPWTADFLRDAGIARSGRLRLVKGSHIVVRRLFEHPYAYILQHPDRRIVFAIPYQQDLTLIGTTDLEFHGDPDKVAIDDAEIAYLCELTRRYFKKPVQAADVVWSYSGVRPLIEDTAAEASAVTRDYRLEFDAAGAPLLSVFGGKITTYRKLAEEAMDGIVRALGRENGPWTENASLPGGDLFGDESGKRAVLEFELYVQGLQRRYAWLPAVLVARYACTYGTRTEGLLAGRSRVEEMGEQLVPGLYEAEAEYLMRHEWARTAADVLWRRTKLGLYASTEQAKRLDDWLCQRQAPALAHE